MFQNLFDIEYLPQLESPILIASFDGWANALNVSGGMADYLIERLKAKRFGAIITDAFYGFDQSRPIVDVKKGRLEVTNRPAGSFHLFQGNPSGRDVIILKALEPSYHWRQFVDSLLFLCEITGVTMIISLAGIYDKVLHTDNVVSAIASDEAIWGILKFKEVNPARYGGPGTIHSMIQSMGQDRGFECISLWCHCPYYLEGSNIPPYGLMSHLLSIISLLIGFNLDTQELDNTWRLFQNELNGLVEKNPELRGIIQNLRKREMVKGSLNGPKKRKKIINLEDFFKLLR